VEVSVRKSHFVRRSVGETPRDPHYTPRRGFCQKVLIWGCFNRRGLGTIKVIAGSMNSSRYVDVLENDLLPQTHIWFGVGAEEHFIFQQDNAPCHSSGETRAFFHENNIRVLDWPPYSPDMNPIENLWAVLKAGIRCRSYNSKVDLLAEIRRLWFYDAQISNCCANLSDSMPRRLRECIRKRGGAISN
jgi:hypothetical protein